MHIRCCAVIWFVFFHSFITWSQEVDYIQFTAKDGLPSNLVYGAAQDTTGYIWLYTDNGVVKFDGYDLVVFDENDGIIDDDIWYIHVDGYNRKWLISSSSVQYYIENDTVKNVPAYIGMSGKIAPNRVYFLDEGLLLRMKDSLYLISPEYVSANERKNTSPAERHTPMVTKLSRTTSSWSNLRRDLILKEQMAFLSGFMDSERSTYILETSTDSISIDPGGRVIKHFTESDTTVINVHGVEGANLHRPLLKDDLIILDYDNGTAVYDPQVKAIVYRENISLPGVQTTRKLTTAGADMRIIGTFNHGVLFKKLNFPFHRSRIGNSIGAIGINSYGLLQCLDRDNVFYNQFNGEWVDNRAYQPYFSNAFLLEENHLFKHRKQFFLYKDNMVIDPESNAINYDVHSDHYANRNKRIETHPIFFSALDDVWQTDTCVWLIKHGGLLKINKDKDTHNIETHPNAIFSSITSFNDEIFIGSNQGVFQRKNGHFIMPPSLTVIREKKVTDLLNMDNNGLAITCTDGAIYILNMTGCTLVSKLKDPIQAMSYTDPYLYGLTNNLLYRKDLSHSHAPAERFYFFGFSGIGGVQCIESYGDSVYLGTNDGIVSIKHSDLRNPTFGIALEELHILGDDKVSKTRPGISYTNEVLTFKYTAVSVQSFGNIRYNVQLLPLDTAWIETKDRTREYNGLMPDHYRFRVKAIDAFGNESPIREISFRIVRPWYHRLELYVASSIMLISLSYFYYRNRFKRVRLAAAEKSRINKRIAELELQALRAQMNPHFIFNAFTAVQNTIRRADVEKTDQYLTKLAHLIRQFLEMSNRKTIRLGDELDLLKLYTDIENIRFDDQIDVQFKVDYQLDLYAVQLPVMIIQPFVENAINHGLYHKSGRRRLELRFTEKDDALIVEIEDNGIGRKMAFMLKSKQGSKFKSRGLDIVDNRIEVLNHTNIWEIDYDFRDLNNEEDNPGTLVTLKIMSF